MKNNKKSNSNSVTALVFDRFYSGKPRAALVIAERMLLAAALSFFCINYTFSQYTMPVSAVGLSFAAAGFSAAFSLLFAVVRRRIAIPVIAILSGVLILWNFNRFWKKFSYFIDAVLLECDGNFFETADLTIHPLAVIERNGVYLSTYVDGVIFGSVILCALFALITAAGVIGKPHIAPSLAAFMILCVPALTSEKLMFGWQVIIIVALYAGIFAVGSYYRAGLPIRRAYSVGGYQRKLAMDDRRFNAALRSQSIGQRASARGIRYSKYFSSVMSAAAMFAALGIFFSAVFADSSGIDYQSLYNKLQGISIGGKNNPFLSGPEADYFTSSLDSIYKSNNRLNLTAPSSSTKEIIRVTKKVGEKPLYLRGDVGIDFDGVSWTSTVASEPTDWEDLRGRWLPVEQTALALALDTYYNFGFSRVVEYIPVTVEYLCDTDTVFTPAYDERLSAFEPEFNAYTGSKSEQSFDVFGDYAARRRPEHETAVGERLEYIAIVPRYTDALDTTDVSRFRTAGNACETYMDDGFMNSVLSEGLKDIGSNLWNDPEYSYYTNYVEAHYLGVPDDLKPRLEEFIETSGLNERRESTKKMYLSLLPYAKDNNIGDRFLSAKAVSEFLKENYTYSRDARIDRRDPVMSFLNDAKSGHCALYASAMTLILREWGIPARYCTGFAVNADMSAQTLRSRDLHAWCEVYLDELGWVTFDPTASAVLNNGGNTSDTSGNSETSDTSENSSGGDTPVSRPAEESSADVGGNSSNAAQSAASDSTQSSETHESNADPQQSGGSGISGGSDDSGGSGGSGGTGGSGSPADFLPYLLKILAAAAAAALIFFIIRAHINFKKRAYKQVQSFHREKNSELVYEKLLAVLALCKLVPGSGEQPHEFFERAEETLGCDIGSSYAVLESLAFGETELDASERAMLGRVFERVYRAAESRFKFIGKIRLRGLVLSPLSRRR